ncbi:MAG: hypothetical protein GY754_40175 [bacterium]|nr:hypothetical protein [bacterium]
MKKNSFGVLVLLFALSLLIFSGCGLGFDEDTPPDDTNAARWGSAKWDKNKWK